MVPVRTRALVLNEPGSFEVQTFATPAVEHRTALLRVEIVGVCSTDVKTYEGKSPYPLPLVLGHEIVGTIAEAGSGFLSDHNVSLGDRVGVSARLPCNSCCSCASGNYTACETPAGYGTWTAASTPPHLWGGMAEYMFLASNSLLQKMPVSLSPEASLVGQSIIANGFEWVHRVGSLQRGQILLIQGCGPQAFGCAVAAVSLGASRVFMTGLGRDVARLEFAESLGVQTIVSDRDDVKSSIRNATGGVLPGLVINLTGSAPTLGESIENTANRGTVLVAGLSGSRVEASLQIDELVWRQITIVGCFSKSREAVNQAVELLSGDPKWADVAASFVSECVSLDEAEQAIVRMKNGTFTGLKMAINPQLGSES